MATEKTRGRIIPWQDLPVPSEGDAQSRRQYKKRVRQYQSAMEAYCAMAAEFHKDLLKPKDFPKREK